ncbi:MAG: hypothetical protein PHU77_13820 [Simplicispira sp.]|nr:hypothetical protein [Simplicispira sp.]
MSLEQTLALVEQQLEQVSGHLLANDALALERSSAELRSALVSLSEAMALARRQQVPSPALAQRLQDIQSRLGAQRQGLARIAAGADRLAAVLLPADADASTYGRALGVRRVSGAGARIYSSTRQH